MSQFLLPRTDLAVLLQFGALLVLVAAAGWVVILGLSLGF